MFFLSELIAQEATGYVEWAPSSTSLVSSENIYFRKLTGILKIILTPYKYKNDNGHKNQVYEHLWSLMLVSGLIRTHITRIDI